MFVKEMGGSRFFIGAALFFAISGTAFHWARANSLPENIQSVVAAGTPWQSPQWHQLLHYHPRWFGGFKSRADGASFFLSPEGKFSPKKEFEATVTAFFKPVGEDPNEHARCRFPARFTWVSKELNLKDSNLPQPDCKKLADWKAALRPAGATLVFASFYVNNPASMFGHTMIRLDRERNERNPPLLDYSINYAANTGEEPGVLYAILGLTGGYPGTFTTYPYYAKVQEYVNFESRDIWEYPLNLSAGQLDFMIDHLWEVGHTHFQYFFIDENCSFHLLSLLEATNPTLDLMKGLPFFVIPTDTVKAVVSAEGLAAAPKYRPSRLRRFKAKLATLSSAEVQSLERIVRKGDPKLEAKRTDIEVERKSHVFDAALDYFAYHTPGRERNERHAAVLRLRSELPPKEDEIVPPIDSPPHTGHGSFRTGVGGGVRANEGFAEMHVRMAYHDLLGREEGLPRNSAIEALRIRLRTYFDTETIRLEDATIIDVTSLFPYDRWTRKPSWNVSFGWKTLHSDACGDCGTTFVRAGPGASLESRILHRELFYFLGNLQANIAPWNATNYRLGPEGVGGVLIHFLPAWMLQLSGNIDYSPLGAPKMGYQFGAMSRLSFGRNWEVRFGATKDAQSAEASASLFRYL